MPCARYLITSAALRSHAKTKEHKKRFKVVTTEVPYTLEEAEMAGGLFRKPAEMQKLHGKAAANQTAAIQKFVIEEETKQAEQGDEAMK